MENIKKNYKLKLCRHYGKGKCDRSKEICNYAHGKDDLREFKKECINGLKCFKKDCNFNHPKGWNYKYNLKICDYYKNGYCINEANCKFRHDDEELEEVIDNNIEDHENKEFFKSDNYDYIKNVVKGFIHEDIIYKIIEDNRKKYNADKTDLSLDFTLIVDGIEIENTKDIFTDSNNKNKSNNTQFNKKEVEKQNIDNTNELIDDLQKYFEKDIKELKMYIDELFLNDKKMHGINMKIELNKIMSEINLFKNNYKDIINMINIERGLNWERFINI
jgi:hypothetical protein